MHPVVSTRTPSPTGVLGIAASLSRKKNHCCHDHITTAPSQQCCHDANFKHPHTEVRNTSAQVCVAHSADLEFAIVVIYINMGCFSSKRMYKTSFLAARQRESLLGIEELDAQSLVCSNSIGEHGLCFCKHSKSAGAAAVAAYMQVDKVLKPT